MNDNKQYRLHKIIILLCSLVFCIGLLSGCGSKNRYGSKKSDDGRSYGGLITLEQENTAHTAFFDLAIEDAKKYDTYQFADGLYQAEEGTIYLVITVTIKNTYAEDLSMSITDFTLDYEGKKKKEIVYGYGKAEVMSDMMMENLFTLKKGDSITKSILYIVPEMESYSLNYTEFYSDEFKGDTYSIAITPQKSIPITTEATTAESTAQNEDATESTN